MNMENKQSPPSNELTNKASALSRDISDNKNVILIAPPLSISVDRNHDYKSKEVDTIISVGILMIAKTLKNKGFNVTILDTHNDPRYKYKTTLELAKEIKIQNPLFVGFSANIDSINFIRDVRMHLKSLFSSMPEPILLAGGSLANSNPIELIEDTNLDLLISGDPAEKGLEDLIDSIERNKPWWEQKGLVFKAHDKKIVYTGQDIKRTKRQLPDYEALPLEIYKNLDFFPIFINLGCAYKCNNCGGISELEKLEDDYIFQQLDYAVKIGVKNLEFRDNDFFSISSRRLELILNKLKELNIPWRCGGKPDSEKITDKLIVKMKESGCIGIHLDMQHVSNEIHENCYLFRKKILKISKTKNRNVINTYDEVIIRLKKAELNVSGTLRMGYPNETLEEHKAMIEFILKHKINISDPRPISPPGSKFFNMSAKKANDENFSKTYILKAFSVYLSDKLNTNELTKKLFHFFNLSEISDEILLKSSNAISSLKKDNSWYSWDIEKAKKEFFPHLFL